RRTAVDEHATLGIAKPGPHDLFGWAQLLVVKRAALSVSHPTVIAAYPVEFRGQILIRSQELYDRWRETLRYQVGVTRLPRLWTLLRCEELRQQGMESAAPLGQDSSCSPSDEAARRGPRHDHHSRAGRTQGAAVVRHPAGLRGPGRPRRPADRHG